MELTAGQKAARTRRRRAAAAKAALTRKRRAAGRKAAATKRLRSKVLLDNHRVRVLELRLDPGQSEPLHSHPDYLVYVLSPATMRMTAADGSTKVVDLRAGQVSFGPPTTHAGTNVGDTTLHELIVELK